MRTHLLPVAALAAAMLASAPWAPPVSAQEEYTKPIAITKRTVSDTTGTWGTTRSDTVTRAYTDGAAQSPAQAAVFDGRARWEQAALAATGVGYAELVGAWKEIAVSSVAYHHLLQRTPTAAELRQRITELKGGKPWTVLWRELATSPERDQRFGFFAAAPMTPAEAMALYQLPHQRGGEQCFGGLGVRCEGGVPESYAAVQPKWINAFTMPDGTRMSYVEVGVAVGSILHDNTCVDAPQGTGVACNGYLFGQDWSKTSGQAAAMEWNKAAWNVMDGRTWRATFGPYPIELAQRGSWYDDLRRVAARSAKMAPTIGPLTSPVPTEPYPGPERKQTAVLRAPSNTSLDISDAAFCASGAFASVTNLVIKAWGVCK